MVLHSFVVNFFNVRVKLYYSNWAKTFFVIRVDLWLFWEK